MLCTERLNNCEKGAVIQFWVFESKQLADVDSGCCCGQPTLPPNAVREQPQQQLLNSKSDFNLRKTFNFHFFLVAAD